MSGARPLYLSAGFIMEEGFPVEELRRILVSMRAAADEAGVQVVTGDTKVVQKGSADKIFINTAGIGIVESPVRLSAARASGRQGCFKRHHRRPRHDHHDRARRAGA
jgi:hydrogenase expression/formation protein HypE